MSGAFDPYFKWLSIHPEQQPPDHYVLLGVKRFESNPDAIENAVDGRKRFLEAFTGGQHAVDAQRLIDEVDAAGTCLLNSGSKARYDKQLRAKQKKLKRAKRLVKAKPLPDGESPTSALTNQNAAIKVSAGVGRDQPRLVSDPDDVPASARLNTSTSAFRSRLRKRKTPPLNTVAMTATVATLAFLVALIVIFTFATRSKPESSQQKEVAKAVDSPSLPSEPSQPTRQDGDRPVVATSQTPPESEGNATGTEVGADANQPATIQVNLPVDEGTPPGVERPEEVAKPTSAQLTGPSRRPVPDAGKRDAAVVFVREVFEADIENAADDRALIAKLLDEMLLHADQPELEDAELFAVLSEARRVAIQGGLAGHAIKIVDQIGRAFEVSTWDIRLRTLKELRKLRQSSEAKTDLAQACAHLLDEAVATELYEVLPSLIDVWRSATARPASDEEIALRKEFIEREKSVEAMLRAWDDLSQARKTLEERPDDSAANLRMGKFYCFVRDDWTTGLSYLALGGDHPLAKAAMQELVVPSDPAAQLELADIWYAAAADAMTSEKGHIEAHALDWYRTCVSDLEGLKQTYVEKRIALLTPDEPRESGAARDDDLDEKGPEKLPTKIIARRVTRSAFAQISSQYGDRVVNLGSFPHFVFNLRPRTIALDRTALYLRAVFHGPATSSGVVRVRIGQRGIPFPAREANVGTWIASTVDQQWLKFNLSAFGNTEVELIHIDCLVTQGTGRIEPRIAIWAIDPDLEE